jgi:hypothetical protein
LCERGGRYLVARGGPAAVVGEMQAERIRLLFEHRAHVDDLKPGLTQESNERPVCPRDLPPMRVCAGPERARRNNENDGATASHKTS